MTRAPRLSRMGPKTIFARYDVQPPSVKHRFSCPALSTMGCFASIASYAAHPNTTPAVVRVWV